jgi:hypothetical protein
VGYRREGTRAMRLADREGDQKALVSVRRRRALSYLVESIRSASRSAHHSTHVDPQGILGSQGVYNGRSALGHHYSSDVTRLHHEEVAESDFAALYIYMCVYIILYTRF